MKRKPNTAARFSLRAGWWIRQAMRQALRNAQQPVQVPGGALRAQMIA